MKAGTANWWRSIKTMESGTKAKSPAHYLIDDALCDPQTFVNKQNDYYSSLATPKQEPADLDKQSIYHPDEISIGQVKKYLRQMDSRKSVHSGDFPPWITKMCCEDVCTPITNIVNHALREQIFPAMYKSAEITPVPKHSSASTCKDYRPISLLWHVGKVVEHFINIKLRSSLLPKLNTNQYAYMNGIGCTDALVALFDDISTKMDDSRNFGVQLILYDFSKAFDLMQHHLLQDKLMNLDIPLPMRAMIADYLSDRKQCVSLKQQCVRSTVSTCNVGVPQGTLLGPTLWLAFVNSLQFSEGSTIKYADDTTSYFPLSKSANNITNTTPTEMTFDPPETGQQLINECSSWSHHNDMQLNAAKTKIMNISLRKTLKMTGFHELDGVHNIDTVTDTKLLGVNIDSHLSFQKHIDTITQTANRKCHGLVVLKRAGINTSSLVVLYQSQIRPSVTYSAAAWYPYTTSTQQEQLEMTQKLALRIIFPEVEHYCDRLEMAGINNLCMELDLICRKYARKVYEHPDHVLHDRIPRRPVGQRFSRRVSTSDIYIQKTRTDKCGKSVLRNLKFFA